MTEVPKTPLQHVAAYTEEQKRFNAGLQEALRMEPTRDLCMTLLASAQENAKDETKKKKTKKILHIASLFIKETWDEEAKVGKVDDALVKDFTEVLNLQEYVGDTQKAKETAGFITPRLLAYEATTDISRDDDHIRAADGLKAKCIGYIDNDTSVYHQQLLDSIANDEIQKRVVGITAVNKIKRGDIDAAMSDVQQYDAAHPFVSSVFPYLEESIAEGNSENAACIFDRIYDTFPDEFTDENTRILGQKEVIPVLISVEREEVLASMIVDSFASDRENQEKYQKSIAYAMHAGAHYASYDHTPTSMRGFLQLLPKDHKEAAEDSYRTALTNRLHQKAS